MTRLLPFALLGLPLLTAAACGLISSARWREVVHIVGTLLSTGAVVWLVSTVMTRGPIADNNGFFLVDSLSALLLIIVTLVTLTGALHSIGYIRHDALHGELSPRQLRAYYTWFHMFVATMYFALIVNNLGIVWVAIEGTTITSAFLVALYRKAEALEAAWKYLMLCSVGIAFALLGLIFLYSSAQTAYGPGDNRLNFIYLIHASHGLPTSALMIAFVLVLVGYGTKVGLAPLHFWLPDAHSQAPSPISAMLSGALLSTALYAILRIVIIVHHTHPSALVTGLCLAMGLLSLVVAFPFLLLQQDIKRMLAFSSVEQMGILLFGVGIGGEAGLLAVVLQMFNHAMAKSTLFMTAGNLVQQYHTKQMSRMRGVLKGSPFSGTVFVIATLALVGAPPFSLFTSEWALSAAGVSQGHPWLTLIFILLLAALFGATLYQLGRIVFGRPTSVKLPATSQWSLWPLLIPLCFVVVFGLFIPAPFQNLFHSAAGVLEGRLL
ncbi:MAG: hydrogenase 4 subunit F [Firmicutes bacterium]|nr:hydrogenase 4 subunit F [Bacillota bacterium]